MRLLWLILLSSIFLAMKISCDTQVIEFDLERRAGSNFFEVQPNQIPLKNQDFTICLRCKFWTWNTRIIFKGDNFFMGIATSDFESGVVFHNSTFARFSAKGLKISSSLWNSMCLVYSSKMPSLTIAINDFVEVLSANVTKIDIASIQRRITIGSSSEPNMFSGQVTDLNVWNSALNETYFKAFIRCSNEFLQRY